MVKEKFNELKSLDANFNAGTKPFTALSYREAAKAEVHSQKFKCSKGYLKIAIRTKIGRSEFDGDQINVEYLHDKSEWKGNDIPGVLVTIVPEAEQKKLSKTLVPSLRDRSKDFTLDPKKPLKITFPLVDLGLEEATKENWIIRINLIFPEEKE